MATRWFPCFARPPWCFVPGASQHRGQIFFSFSFFLKMYLSSHVVKGQHAGKEGVSLPGGLGPPTLGIAEEGLPLPAAGLCGPSFLSSPCPGPGSRSTSGVARLSQRRLTSLAPALFRLIMEEQPQRVQASPFYPGFLVLLKNT